jgi:nucleotide-binding universal stress UspA family protein
MHGDILFPTDFSAGSECAFRHAEHLGSHLRCRLIVLHATTDTSHGAEGEVRYSELQRKLNRIESKLAPLDRRLVMAKPGPAICELAQQLDCRLILMSAPRLRGIAHLGFGGVHDYVLRHATCPVMSLRNHIIKQPAEPEKAICIDPQLGVVPG